MRYSWFFWWFQILSFLWLVPVKCRIFCIFLIIRIALTTFHWLRSQCTFWLFWAFLEIDKVLLHIRLVIQLTSPLFTMPDCSTFRKWFHGVGFALWSTLAVIVFVSYLNNFSNRPPCLLIPSADWLNFGLGSPIKSSILAFSSCLHFFNIIEDLLGSCTNFLQT